MKKSLTKKERFVCTMIWGGVPLDVQWVRRTEIFKNGMKRFESGKWKKLHNYEN